VTGKIPSSSSKPRDKGQRRGRNQGTPPPTRREAERLARIEWILDNALDLVMAEGLGGLTTPRLAKQLRYTVGAMYRYFDSKEALLEALQRRTALVFYTDVFARLQNLQSELDRRLPKKTPRISALASVLLLPKVYAEVALDHPKHFELIGMLVTQERKWLTPLEAVRLRALVMPRVADLVGIFERAQTSGALAAGDDVQRTMAMWFSVHAVLAAAPLARAHPELLDCNTLLAFVVNSLLTGWGAKQADLAAARAALPGVNRSRTSAQLQAAR
jgi:AcrR family transcriptional regulator